MKKESAINIVVDSLNDLSGAFATYDQALFYFDETLDPQKLVDTDRTYKKILDDHLPKGQVLDSFSIKKLKNIAYEIGIATAETYAFAISALDSQYRSTTDKQSQLLESKIFNSRWLASRTLKKATIFDRDVEASRRSTRKHLAKGLSLATDLVLRFQAHKANFTWCPYSAEFDTLRDICEISTQEIDYLNDRSSAISDFFHKIRSEYTTYAALTLAVIGLGFTALGTWKSPNDGKAPSSNNALQESTSTAIAIEIGKIREHTSDIEHSLKSLSKDQASSTTGK